MLPTDQTSCSLGSSQHRVTFQAGGRNHEWVTEIPAWQVEPGRFLERRYECGTVLCSAQQAWKKRPGKVDWSARSSDSPNASTAWRWAEPSREVPPTTTAVMAPSQHSHFFEPKHPLRFLPLLLMNHLLTTCSKHLPRTARIFQPHMSWGLWFTPSLSTAFPDCFNCVSETLSLADLSLWFLFSFLSPPPPPPPPPPPLPTTGSNHSQCRMLWMHEMIYFYISLSLLGHYPSLSLPSIPSSWFLPFWHIRGPH